MRIRFAVARFALAVVISALIGFGRGFAIYAVCTGGCAMIDWIPDMQSRSTTSAGNSKTATDRKAMLSTLWIFAVMNYIYADVFTAMDPSAEGGSVRMSHGMMLGAAALMETAMVMVPLSRFLRYRANRWANIVVGVMHTMAVILSLFVGGAMPASYYLLFASVEVISTLFIVCYAWKWHNVEIG